MGSQRLGDVTDRPWLKSYDKEVPPSITYEEIPLFALLDRSVERFPKRRALTFRNWKASYAKLGQMVDVMAHNLREQGVRNGDRVSIMLPNIPQTVITYWAALKAGAIVVMTNPLYMEKELVHQFKDSGSTVLVTLDHLWPKIDGLRDKIPVNKFIVTKIDDCLGFPLNLLYGVKAKRSGLYREVPYDGETVVPWKPLIKGKETYCCKIEDPREQIALLQYTGGTTGVSKGCMLTHFNLMANVEQIQNVLNGLEKESQIFLGLLPYFHVYGLCTSLNWPTCLGAELIPFPRFVPRDVLEAINKYKPTVFPGAPSVYISLMQQKDINKYDLTSINYLVSGSAPMPVDMIRQYENKVGASILEGYGLTEASPVTHLNPLRREGRVGSIGLPFPDTEARIVDMEVGSVPLEPGKVGELLIRGPQVMKGYWNRPDETASTLRNGWLYTGDIATMDEDGFFYIVDRKKDMVITGGYNVYPREIDEVLHEHPKIKEAVAVGVPHPGRGEIIKAYIVPIDGEKLTRAEVIGHCRQQLANYKVPRQVEFREDLPKTIVGKVLRRALRTEEEEKLKAAGKLECPSEPERLGGAEADVILSEEAGSVDDLPDTDDIRETEDTATEVPESNSETPETAETDSEAVSYKDAKKQAKESVKSAKMAAKESLKSARQAAKGSKPAKKKGK